MAGRHPISLVLHSLSEFLERERKKGAGGVSLSARAEGELRSLPRALMQLEGRLKAPPVRATTQEEGGGPRLETRNPAPAFEEPVEGRTEDWARNQLNAIYREVKNSTVARDLGSLFETVVFATGNPMADLMFVGEAPGAEEEKVRQPFVGPAGQKLNQIIGAMGLKREDVYISNIVKFRPKKGDGRFQGAGNRKPDPTEMAACMPFIRREIEIVQPKVIVALGLTAAEGLLEVGGSISALRRVDHEFAGVPVIVTYHPSYLLRQESETDLAKAKAAKRAVWEDILRAMEKLGMPISEKQRAYFT